MTIKRDRVKDAIMKWVPGMTMVHHKECKCVGCLLWKELELDK